MLRPLHAEDPATRAFLPKVFSTITATGAPNPATKSDLGPSQPARRDSRLGFYTLDTPPADGGASGTWARGGYRFWPGDNNLSRRT